LFKAGAEQRPPAYGKAAPNENEKTNPIARAELLAKRKNEPNCSQPKIRKRAVLLVAER
jgi:hypothetical protein